MDALSHPLQLLVRYVESSGQAGGKIVKAVNALQGAGMSTGMHDRRGIVAAIRADILATERLRALRTAA